MYFLLRPKSCASAVAEDSVTMVLVAETRCGSCKLPVDEHKDLITLTKTRVPSLFTGTESDRRTRLKIWSKPDSDCLVSSDVETNATALSTIAPRQK